MTVHLIRLRGTARRRSGPVSEAQVVAGRAAHAVAAHRAAHGGTVPLLQTRARRRSHSAGQAAVPETRH